MGFAPNNISSFQNSTQLSELFVMQRKVLASVKLVSNVDTARLISVGLNLHRERVETYFAEKEEILSTEVFWKFWEQPPRIDVFRLIFLLPLGLGWRGCGNSIILIIQHIRIFHVFAASEDSLKLHSAIQSTLSLCFRFYHYTNK